MAPLFIEGKESLISNKCSETYFSRGKLLLCGEYFLLDGAKGLALPLKLGQSLNVKHARSYNPKLTWSAYDVNGKEWFKTELEFWHFDPVEENPSKETLLLSKILKQVRKQNPHFLRDGASIEVETRIGFPLEWGLGSSSTLIYNIAQWAYTSPFELLFNTIGGSGYDIAAAQSEGPIIYQNSGDGPNWQTVDFNPKFKENLAFVYLGRKQSTGDSIKFYKDKCKVKPESIMAVSRLSEEMIESSSIEEFNFNISGIETIVSRELGLKRVKDEKFSDFNGEVKSLGAWGGDFVLASGLEGFNSIKRYFNDLGYSQVFKYTDFILEN